MQTKRILFINFGGLGDEILFLPTILSVKKQYPDSHITLVLEERSKGIVSLTNIIDEVISVNIKDECVNRGKYSGKIKQYIELFNLLIKIWGNNYDAVISSGSNKFIAVFLFLTLIKKRFGYNTGKISQLLLTRAVELNKNQYAVNMYHDLVQNITDIRTELPELSIQKKPIIPNSVLVHPGVSKLSVQKGMIKTISPKQWAEVIEGLADKGKRVFLIGGPDDKECISIINSIISPDKYENLYGTTKSLKDLAELISGMETFLCSDSAPLHIAVALGVRTYVIFGSTDDKKLIPNKTYEGRGKVTAIKADCDCPLMPCLWERRQTTCAELDCLKIPAEKIVNAVISNE